MEIELSEEQAKKVEILQENDIDVGQAIDILFEMKESVIESSSNLLEFRKSEVEKEKAELEAKLAKVDDQLTFFEKLSDNTIDASQKQKIVEKEYGKINITYDESVQSAKHKFKWSKSLFKF